MCGLQFNNNLDCTYCSCLGGSGGRIIVSVSVSLSGVTTSCSGGNSPTLSSSICQMGAAGTIVQNVNQVITVTIGGNYPGTSDQMQIAQTTMGNLTFEG